jgi:hypothetical protein
MTEASESSEATRHRVEQHLVAFFHDTRIHDVFGQQLAIAHEALAIGERANRYDVRFFPAIAKHNPIRGKSTIELSFAVFTPTGDLRTRRDDEEEGRRPDQPNTALTEMAVDLNPRSSHMQRMHASMTARFDERWPGKHFAYLATVASAELDLVCVFVQVESLEQLARELQ